MSLSPGTRLGTYEIGALIGAGGMGEVYRARDTTLDRLVAVKVLPKSLAGDRDRIARFEREARTLAALNHPHIAQIHGFEASGGVLALVMELVEGRTLEDRIAQGRLPLDEALAIARQVADALNAAHEQGIVHRDLKPANIKLRPDGAVKVLDFGLAKTVDPVSGASPNVTATPTITTPAQMTAIGTVLGTAAYMSPEQAKGLVADRRSDVWGFGCIVYEMLSGRRPFEGDGVADMLAAILRAEPDWSRLPPGTPEGIRRLLERCLRKDCRIRLHSLADARIEIDDSQHEPLPKPLAAPRYRAWLPWTVVALTVLAALAQWAWLRRTPAETRREVRFEVATPTTTDPTSLTVSPDGSRIVFVAMSEGRGQLWLRSLGSIATQPLPGTEDAVLPFWSPDSRSVGFFANGRLLRLDLDNGLIRPLTVAPNPLGGAWNGDGTIVFAPNYTGPIFRTTATGGDAQQLTRMEAGQSSHGFPRFLPDGRRFLYFVTGTGQIPGVYVGNLDGAPGSRIADADTPASFAVSRLLFVRQGTLYAQEFDPAALTLRGSPVAVADQIPTDAISNLAAFSASPSGTVAYRSGSAGGQRQFLWFDRSGRENGRVWESDRATAGIAMTPDGRRFYTNRLVDGNSDIWTIDVARGVASRVTSNPAQELNAIPSPDGSRIVFNSNRNGVYDLFVTSTTAGGSEDVLLATPQNKAANDWSPDGRFILFRSPAKTTGFDLWALPTERDHTPFPVVQTNFDERDVQFSPDGRWIAYQSNASGRVEIYVQPFPKGQREQISTAGGAQVRWRRDGKELFYIALDARLMAVPITFGPAGRTIEAGVPAPLFTTRVGGAIQGPIGFQYAVSPDGQRFLMSTVSDTHTPAITVILNWKPSGGTNQ